MAARQKVFLFQLWFIFISSLGGFVLSTLGMSIGWIVGSLLIASLLAFWQPKKIGIHYVEKGIKVHWQQIGQCIIGVQLAQSINLSVLHIFATSWFTILFMLLLSIVLSLCSGLILCRLGNTELLTGLFATSPGGIATMPAIAEEVGANTGVVSVVQILRIFLVVTIVPIALFYIAIGGTNTEGAVAANDIAAISEQFTWDSVAWAFVIFVGAVAGAFAGKRVKLPAPWLVGGLLGAFITQTLCSYLSGQNFIIWWPHWLVIIGQVLIGAGIGSRFRKSMFVGLRKILLISSLGTVALIIAMFFCSYIVSVVTGLSFITSVLAFAPGGVVEMATASVAMGADSTFVVAVQTLRLVLVILILPPFFRFVYQKRMQKRINSTISG